MRGGQRDTAEPFLPFFNMSRYLDPNMNGALYENTCFQLQCFVRMKKA